MRDGVLAGVGNDDWAALVRAARTVAAAHRGRVFVADAAAVWGQEFVRYSPTGIPLRKPDGIHVCPLGAALLGEFVVGWLGAHFGGVSPADPATWPTSWWTDPRYDNPRGVCVASCLEAGS